ncbi:hypothetical protein ACH5RR_023118 [Cinchona calisaya]|uniref:Uncharacterized protein n=1 Tax=Cinchona calisaya TaxID=153742 RepID=A0ABD2Z9Q3_9GENT
MIGSWYERMIIHTRTETAQTPTVGSNGEFSAMDKSLMEQCRMEVQGARVMNFFSRRRSNDGTTLPKVVTLISRRNAKGRASDWNEVVTRERKIEEMDEVSNAFRIADPSVRLA